MIKWKGVFPAVTTKFTSDDQLDLKAFQFNIQTQMEAGVHGIILGGSLGEASTLTSSEKETLIKATLEVVEGKIPVVLTIAEQSTKGAIESVKAANESGIEGFMALPPMRYKADDRETISFFKKIAQSTDLPIMIYNNPVDYKILVTLDMFEELSAFGNIQSVNQNDQ
jgi:4-hydroxy-tetrahydrodipicolinate synthase